MTATDAARPTDAPVVAARVSDHVELDLVAPFTDGFPHAAFDVLRAAAPVAWADEDLSSYPSGPIRDRLVESPGFWVVSSHALVSQVSRTPDVFSSQVGGTAIPQFDEMALTMGRQMLINMDAPGHSRLRRVLQPLFTPRAVGKLTENVTTNAVDIADAVDPAGCDLVLTATAELPLRVLADLLGMPREDRHLLFDWSNKVIGVQDPEYQGDLAETMASLMEMFAYGKTIADDRRATPRDDIISLIANAEVDGQPLTDVEFSMFWLLLIIAGNETTRNSTSGAVVALHDQDRWGWLRAHPEHLPTAVEELIRFVAPVMHMRRTATQDIELGGQAIRAGDKVVVWYPAANRDPAVFDQPHVLDLTRDPNAHLGFGVGAHFCLGAHLARLQLTAMLGELLRRFASVEVDGVERVHSNFIDGIRHLQVRFQPAA